MSLEPTLQNTKNGRPTHPHAAENRASAILLGRLLPRSAPNGRCCKKSVTSARCAAVHTVTSVTVTVTGVTWPVSPKQKGQLKSRPLLMTLVGARYAARFAILATVARLQPVAA